MTHDTGEVTQGKVLCAVFASTCFCSREGGSPFRGVFPAWKLVVFAGKQGEISASRATQRTVPCAGPVAQSSQGGGRPLAAPTARVGGDGEQCSPLRAGAGGKQRTAESRPYGGCGRGVGDAAPYGGKVLVLSLRGPVRPVAIRFPRPLFNVFK